MSEQDTTTTDVTVETPQEPAAATPEAPKPEAPKPSSPWDDPAAAKAEIERLRRENASDRTTAKAKAAEEARNELAKALGLIKEDEPADPAQLTKQLADERTAAQQARVELAVFKAATAAGGDPAALLDSSSFLRSLEGVDPTDVAAVSAAIASAVEANPRLAHVRAPAPNPAQGASAGGAVTPSQLSEADIQRMSPEDVAKAYDDGRFDNLIYRKS